jgi:hypothetical protein
MEPVDITIQQGDSTVTLHFASAEAARAALASSDLDAATRKAVEDGLESEHVLPAAEPVSWVTVMCGDTNHRACALQFVVAATTPVSGDKCAAWLADILVQLSIWIWPARRGWWRFLWIEGRVTTVAAWFDSADDSGTEVSDIFTKDVAQLARTTALPVELAGVTLITVSAVSKGAHEATLARAVPAGSRCAAASRLFGRMQRRVNISRCAITVVDGHATSTSFLVRVALPEGALSRPLRDATALWVKAALTNVKIGSTAGSWRVKGAAFGSCSASGLFVLARFFGDWNSLETASNPLWDATLGAGCKAKSVAEELRGTPLPDELVDAIAVGVSAVSPPNSAWDFPYLAWE